MNVYFKRMLEAYSAGEMSKIDEIAKEFVQSFSNKDAEEANEVPAGITYNLVIDNELSSPVSSFEEAVEWAKESGLETTGELYKENHPTIYIVEFTNGIESNAWKFNYTVEHDGDDSTRDIQIGSVSVDKVDLSEITYSKG